ncbi:hypothetical protein ACFQDG_19240, partial [Natronoarchaeum mannanilyticum]|uniref:hypothetical protein n=1 Tax=Natronoarchaeum mannanilyticum TaxID=926360 RepID=UPI003613D15F
EGELAQLEDGLAQRVELLAVLLSGHRQATSVPPVRPVAAPAPPPSSGRVSDITRRETITE